MRLIIKLIQNEKGAAAAEYAVLLGCIALLLFAAINQLSDALGGLFKAMTDFFTSVDFG